MFIQNTACLMGSDLLTNGVNMPKKWGLNILPSQIMVLMPGLSVMLSFQRAIQVASHDTAPLTWATLVEVIGIVTILFILTFYRNTIGVVAATIALMIGRIGANLFLIKPNKLAMTKFSN